MHNAPIDVTDPLQLADWLEVEALLQTDNDSSIGDAERQLQRSGVTGDDDEAAGAILADVLTELQARSRAAGAAYPFELDGKVVRLKAAGWKEFTPYTYCLVFSEVGYEWKKSTQPMARLFEEVSQAAAQAYVDGEAFRLGAPRTSTKTGFKDALKEFQAAFAEGTGILDWEELSPQDDHLDLIAWRHHPDRQIGKLLLFGQCAGGDGWRAKLTELRPDAFVDRWIPGTVISPIIQAFFIPHRFRNVPELWKSHTLDGGIVFDRCRTAFWAHRSATTVAADGWQEHRQWLAKKLKELQA